MSYIAKHAPGGDLERDACALLPDAQRFAVVDKELTGRGAGCVEHHQQTARQLYGCQYGMRIDKG